jgi:hypothetical protein
VYAGVDPVSKKKHYLVETIPAGPKAEKLAEQARVRLLAQVDERRNPRTNATVNQLIGRHLDLLAASPRWVSTCRTYHRLHIGPLIGSVKAGALDADILDSFYAELRRCRVHCDRRAYVEHRTTRKHRCDEHDDKPCLPPDPECRACRRRCRPHGCRPLGATTIRQIHFLLHGAYKRAARWKWVPVNPITDAEPPPPPAPNPHPTTVDETARIINEAWSDPDWGAFIWLAVACGGRRAELCALQWGEVDLDRAVITLKRAVAKNAQGRWYLKDTKTHQQRRVALDPLTVSVLTAQWERYKRRCAMLQGHCVVRSRRSARHERRHGGSDVGPVEVRTVPAHHFCPRVLARTTSIPGRWPQVLAGQPALERLRNGPVPCSVCRSRTTRSCSRLRRTIRRS